MERKHYACELEAYRMALNSRSTQFSWIGQEPQKLSTAKFPPPIPLIGAIDLDPRKLFPRIKKKFQSTEIVCLENLPPYGINFLLLVC